MVTREGTRSKSRKAGIVAKILAGSALAGTLLIPSIASGEASQRKEPQFKTLKEGFKGSLYLSDGLEEKVHTKKGVRHYIDAIEPFWPTSLSEITKIDIEKDDGERSYMIHEKDGELYLTPRKDNLGPIIENIDSFSSGYGNLSDDIIKQYDYMKKNNKSIYVPSFGNQKIGYFDFIDHIIKNKDSGLDWELKKEFRKVFMKYFVDGQFKGLAYNDDLLFDDGDVGKFIGSMHVHINASKPSFQDLLQTSNPEVVLSHQKDGESAIMYYISSGKYEKLRKYDYDTSLEEITQTIGEVPKIKGTWNKKNSSYDVSISCKGDFSSYVDLSDGGFEWKSLEEKNSFVIKENYKGCKKACIGKYLIIKDDGKVFKLLTEMSENNGQAKFKYQLIGSGFDN